MSQEDVSRGCLKRVAVARLCGLQLLQAFANVRQLPLQNLPDLIVSSSVGLLESS